jgi:hypothetical protein
LADEIDAAIQAGGSAERQLADLDALRLRSCHLAELGELIDWQLSEATCVDHGQCGKRWRPTVAEPF